MAENVEVGSLAKSIRETYPLHLAVWENRTHDLKTLLSSENGRETLELRDPRNRTPLMLSMTFRHNECSNILMSHNANVNCEDNRGFNVLHEAVSTGDPELISSALERRDFQRYNQRIGGIPVLLKKIRDTPDFYLEMQWTFTSWVPLVSRMCPSDTYKIYKSGSSVRIDTTLLGFDQSNWKRGSRSYIFKGQENGAVFMEIDHDLQQVHVESMKVISPDIAASANLHEPTPEMVQGRLTSPISTTFVDAEKINFERSKAGIIGFRTDRTETVNNYECRVFTANNVEVVTRTRTEHLSEEDKERHKQAMSSRLNPFQSLLGMVETDEKPSLETNSPDTETRNACNLSNITLEQYFDSDFDLGKTDIGKPIEMNTKIQRFKANISLCENFPLSLPEQVLPIVDLMAISSAHFAKLKDFITLQLPSGFPIKIEIPLFHVLNARITFGNIFSLDESVPGVTAIKDDSTCACVVEESCFEPPSNYRTLGNDESRQWSIDDEDELVQMAIQQYLMEEGTESDQVTLWEALRQPDADLQRAIQESLQEYRKAENNTEENSPTASQSPSQLPTQAIVSNGHIPQNVIRLPQRPKINDEIQLAIRLSKQQKEEEDKRRIQEEEILEEVLKLSISEK